MMLGPSIIAMHIGVSQCAATLRDNSEFLEGIKAKYEEQVEFQEHQSAKLKNEVQQLAQKSEEAEAEETSLSTCTWIYLLT